MRWCHACFFFLRFLSTRYEGEVHKGRVATRLYLSLPIVQPPICILLAKAEILLNSLLLKIVASVLESNSKRERERVPISVLEIQAKSIILWCCLKYQKLFPSALSSLREETFFEQSNIMDYLPFKYFYDFYVTYTPEYLLHVTFHFAFKFHRYNCVFSALFSSWMPIHDLFARVRREQSEPGDVDIAVICHSYVTLNIFIGTQWHVVAPTAQSNCNSKFSFCCVLCNATRHRRTCCALQQQLVEG